MNSHQRSSRAPGHSADAVRQVRVDADSAGQRIDNFLLRHLKGAPRSHVYRVLRRGEVRVNRGRVKASYRLRDGDLVRLPPMRLAPSDAPRPAPPERLLALESAILHEDRRLLVIDKPAGMAVHGGSGLSFGLIESLRQSRPEGTLELVHRLDRETSGCLLVSKRRSALRQLHALIRANQIDKRYLALLVGELSESQLTVDAPLRKNVVRGGERMVRVDPQAGRAARTRFRRLARLMVEGRPCTLVEAQLVTGRTHQIRVHAAHLGTPLAGDPKYGDAVANRMLKTAGLARLFLHAHALRLQLDDMCQPLHVVAPLPAQLERFVSTFQVQSSSGVGL